MIMTLTSILVSLALLSAAQGSEAAFSVAPDSLGVQSAVKANSLTTQSPDSLAAAGASSEPESHPLSLRECMEYAVEHSTDVLSQKTKVGDARLERRDAILTAFTPTVEANVYGYYRWGRSIDPETNTYVTTTSLNNGWSVSAGITLFDGFTSINNIKVARTSLSMGLSEQQQAEDKVCLATMEAYFNVLYYTSLVSILKEQVENAESSVRLASRQEELGAKGHADVVQMEADLADREYELVSAENSLSDAMITLEDVMLWPLDAPLVVDTSLEALDEAPVEITPVEDIISNAKNSLPSIAIARGTFDNARTNLRTAKWQFTPTLGLYGGWSTSYYTYPGQAGYVPTPYWNQFTNNGGEYLELSLSFPIYDRLSRFSKLSKKRNEFRRAGYELDKALRDVESEVRRAVQDRDGAEAAFLKAERRAEVQDEAYRLNARKFEQGLISSIEFNSASSACLKAKAEELNARLQYQLKRRIVSYYNGVRYINQ